MKHLLKGVSLFLVGMMGSGKSTVGRILAKKLQYRFYDTDPLVERVAGCTIAELFEQQGEVAFRDLETQVLNQLSAQTQSVIATGGGAILRQQNWGYLRHGVVIWLDVSVEILAKRLQKDKSRPLLQQTELTTTLEQLLAERRSRYQQADLTIPIRQQQSPSIIADSILEQLPTILRSNNPPAERNGGAQNTEGMA